MSTIVVNFIKTYFLPDDIFAFMAMRKQIRSALIPVTMKDIPKNLSSHLFLVKNPNGFALDLPGTNEKINYIRSDRVNIKYGAHLQAGFSMAVDSVSDRLLSLIHSRKNLRVLATSRCTYGLWLTCMLLINTFLFLL